MNLSGKYYTTLPIHPTVSFLCRVSSTSINSFASALSSSFSCSRKIILSVAKPKTVPLLGLDFPTSGLPQPLPFVTIGPRAAIRSRNRLLSPSRYLFSIWLCLFNLPNVCFWFCLFFWFLSRADCLFDAGDFVFDLTLLSESAELLQPTWGRDSCLPGEAVVQ